MAIETSNVDKIGKLADRIDNLLAATKIPMPAAFHLLQLEDALGEISKELKDIYVDVTGENPWGE